MMETQVNWRKQTILLVNVSHSLALKLSKWQSCGM